MQCTFGANKNCLMITLLVHHCNLLSLDRGPTCWSFLASVFIGRFFFESFFWGIDDLQVIQSLVIKSYFMTATWDIVGRVPPHFTFFNF